MSYETAENQYLNWAETILNEGEGDDDRTGVGTIEYFGDPQMKIDLRQEFPLLTTKKVSDHLIRTELVWMLHGDTNLRYLAENNNHIWDEWPFVSYLKNTGQEVPEQNSQEWSSKKSDYLKRIVADQAFANTYGELGPVYGRQWRSWRGSDGETVDQLTNAQDQLRSGKSSRRVIVSAWNAGEIDEMAKSGLPPCHSLFQFNSSSTIDQETGKKYLDMKLYQRSGDWFLGVPFNMAQYALMLSAMAQTTDHTPRYFYHTFGNAHIYNNHVDQVKQQLGRRDQQFDAPQLNINPEVKDIGEFEADDFEIVNYQHHPSIKAQVAI